MTFTADTSQNMGMFGIIIIANHAIKQGLCTFIHLIVILSSNDSKCSAVFRRRTKLLA
jgi:hypothetical protein